ncbi:MAG TPA: thioredoxin domain-containing protein [Candidatus Kapabacteria bacterium]|nr:thioredoxin domain-containing protein [Candidatus Kapabacteria bacterium]
MSVHTEHTDSLHKPNHLIHEKSPYLLQHAYNPVDWYAWGEEAFACAKKEDKPIFLSIGYSTCHWCHVMEHESFEDTATASYMNAHFICIKVDREERPDVDAIYMSATQAMTGSGGWPMSCFLTPDLKPFFCGTYFPPIAAYGRPSFHQLLERITDLWTSRRDDIISSAAELTKAISEQRIEAPTKTSFESAVESCMDFFKKSFDKIEGGFGSAPKFPRPVQFDFLFHYYDISADTDARNMALFTLKKMALGGMNDQLGGGFHRYSVDTKWFAPHFEKMLYDQAQLLESYLDAYQITHDEFYADVAHSIASFVLAKMEHPNGGFYSALDADSEGEEGKYYVWTFDEIKKILGVEAEIFAYRYGITEEGNWEHGYNILFRTHTTPETAKQFEKNVVDVRASLERSRTKLLAERSKRVPPHLDDKILTPWNGIMIAALSRAADVLHAPEYLSAATNASAFIWSELYEQPGGMLVHRWRDAEAKFPAYLESYAFLIKGFLALYEASFDQRWLERAIILQHEQDSLFYDHEHGAYYSSREQTDLIVRMKNDYDGAEPSGNSVSVLNLLRLFELTGNEIYRKNASNTLSYFSGRLTQYPYTMPELLTAAIWQLHPPAEIVFAGEHKRENGAARKLIATRYMPRKVLMYADKQSLHLSGFARSLASDEFTIYYCHNQVCDLPVHNSEELGKLFLTP